MDLLTHLKMRSLDLTRHRVWLSPEENCCAFPLYTLAGQLVGYQQYRPDKPKFVDNSPKESKYFTYRRAGQSWVPWGLELLLPNTKVIFLTEGVFDAARLTSMGQVALAMLTNNPPQEFKNFLNWYRAPKVAVLDNDKAGQALKKFGTYSEVVPEGDLGSAPQDYVNYLLEKYTS